MRPTASLSLHPRFRLALCGMALTALAGCAASRAPTLAAAPPTLPTEHYAIKVEDAPDQVALALHAEGVSGGQQAALSDFVGRWREAGGGVVTIRSSADPACAQEAQTMAYAVEAQLQALGVPTERIRLAAYDAGTPRAPVLVSFMRLTAEGPDCSGGWDNLTSTFGNEPYHHFGCAVTANLAAAIADPRDLVAPPSLAPADGVRRQTVLSKYRDGKLTSAEKDEQASGAISSAVKQ